MTPEDSPDAALREELNRLYWDGDTSVNQLAEDLGISKGTLYELLEPLETRTPCPECGQALLVHRHRTARDRGTLECPNCAAEVEASDVKRPDRRADRPPSRTRSSSTSSGPSSSTPAPAGAVTLSGRGIAGSAILGLAAGLALFLLFRRQ